MNLSSVDIRIVTPLFVLTKESVPVILIMLYSPTVSSQIDNSLSDALQSL